MASVSIRDVRKSFGSHQVLHGVDLDIADGEFVAFVGPSGCGKTTLLRMIAGLEGISGGDISIGERSVNDVPAKDRDIAMVFQNYALYPHKTVRENMSFALKLRRLAATEIGRRVQATAEILGLAGLLDRYPSELSGGQRQRVAMARAIVREPKVFLFDEPLSNLDAKLRVSMRSEIKQLHRRLGATIVYVTHDQIEAMTMADRVVVLRNGIVEQVAPPLELYETPFNTHVATFIGSPSMNMLKGRLARESGKARFVLPNGEGFAVGGAAGALHGEVLLGVRPEDFVISDDGNGLRATITSIEPTGSETVLKARLADSDVTILLRERRRLSLHEEVSVRPSRDRCHFFDPASELRIATGAGESSGVPSWGGRPCGSLRRS